MNVSLINARSVKNKVIPICQLLDEHNILACGVTETWITKSDPAVIRQFKDLGYDIVHCPRTEKKEEELVLCISQGWMLKSVGHLLLVLSNCSRWFCELKSVRVFLQLYIELALLELIG